MGELSRSHTHWGGVEASEGVACANPTRLRALAGPKAREGGIRGSRAFCSYIPYRFYRASVQSRVLRSKGLVCSHDIETWADPKEGAPRHPRAIRLSAPVPSPLEDFLHQAVFSFKKDLFFFFCIEPYPENNHFRGERRDREPRDRGSEFDYLLLRLRRRPAFAPDTYLPCRKC